jgi:hypothetical protein
MFSTLDQLLFAVLPVIGYVAFFRSMAISPVAEMPSRGRRSRNRR